jgi:hypothetical protein
MQPTQSIELTWQIDRCAYLLAKQRENKPWIDELARLKTELRKHCESSPADLPVRLSGATYFLDFTVRENERVITDKPKAFAALRKAMGIDKLIAALTITLKLLDKEIPASSQAKYVITARTGSRDVSGGLLTPLLPLAA